MVDLEKIFKQVDSVSKNKISYVVGGLCVFDG